MLFRSFIFSVCLVLLIVHVNAQAGRSLRQGLIVLKNQRGKIIEQSYYVNDTLHGESIKWHNNGKVYVKCFYNKGRLHGEWFHYDKSGKLILYNYFNNGIRETFKSYWGNGNERVTANFVNGLIDGEMKTFFKNGKVESTVLYRKGGILSALRKYDEKGNLIMIMYPVDTTRDAFIRLEYLDQSGQIRKSESINEKPLSYFLFGADVHRSGPL